jgi:dephospho-CoA kinase
MKVIVLVGSIGSGKDTVSNYISKKYGYHVIVEANILRGIAKRRKIKTTRKNLYNIHKELSKKYGENVLTDRIIKRIKNKKWKKVVINGARKPIDVKNVKKHFEKTVAIFLDSKPEIRFKRLKARKRTGDPKTFKEFQRQEESEWKEFNLKKTLKLVDYKIDNSGTIKDTEKKVDKLLKKIRFE